MINKHIQVMIGIILILAGVIYLSCDSEEGGPKNCPSIYTATEMCNNNGTCDATESVMSCPSDCWDMNSRNKIINSN